MNIFELRKRTQQKIMKGDWDIPGTFQTWLENNGFKQIGKGFFSKVYAQPGSNKVIKVMGINNSSEIRCGTEFAKYQLRTRNKHFPKVYSVKALESGGGYYNPDDPEPAYLPEPMTIIVMENIPNLFDVRKMQWNNDKEYNLGLAAFLINHSILDTQYVATGEAYLPDDYKERLRGTEAIREEHQWRQKYGGHGTLANAVNTIHRLVRKHGCEFADFKYQNTRMREDGTIVLLDALPF